MLSNTLKLNFCCLKIIHILHPRYYSKIIGHDKKWAKKHICLYSWDYTINHNDSEDENEKVRLDYATTHHDPPPSTTTSQNISTATHHQPKYIYHYPLPPTTTHHQPKYIHHHPPPPTDSQNISTTTHHPKNGPPLSKSQNIFIYNLLLTLF